ncbi:DUF6734 family protein [Aquimarina macrocephali]|uniref:DUF6734 family protein n=1 Tax=Aquimarina macrocephali TaxID=666563 RepID=UPI003F67815D
MKIIQSFWTGNKEPLENSYGWLNSKSHYLGWVLSVNQLRLFYDKVELFTDNKGYEILIDKLKLPYTKVHVVLDEINHYPESFWAIAKIKTYSLQNEPFLHVDGDIFIWENFSEDLMNSGLISQNHEITTDYYRKSWNSLSPNLIFKPDELIKYEKGRDYSCNMGVFGGNDIQFLKEYSRKSFDFVNKNKAIWKDINGIDFNIFFEQLLFGQMTLDKSKKVNFLINEDIYDNGYESFGDFDEVPYKKTYLHLLGDYKRDSNTCRMMESYIIKHYPMYFKKIVQLFINEYQNIPGTYNFTKKRNAELINQLKAQIQSKKILENSDEFLLSRDLLSVELPKLFSENIVSEEDFIIIRLPCNEIVSLDSKKEKEELKFFAIKCLDNRDMFFRVDEIDEILVDTIDRYINYRELIFKMLNFLEDDAKNIKEEFVKMIVDRIYFLLKHKIIAISSS